MIYPMIRQFFEEMEPADWVSGVAVTIVVVVLVASGPLAGGLVQPSGTPTTVDEGDASVESATVPVEDLRISPGRFGTKVSYVRVPDATVDLAAVTDRPRLLYRVEIPALDADLTASKIVTDRGTHRLHVGDYGLDSGTVTNESYDATVTVRVQSFTVDRTILERNVTVAVDR